MYIIRKILGEEIKTKKGSEVMEDSKYSGRKEDVSVGG
jgi:hypothetical protein